MPATANIIDRDVTIVGGGFGGCYLLKLLRDRGFSTILLEAGARLGGVWAWSCYPGARVDCELPYYGYSDPDIWSTWNWTERFPEYKQLRSYFEHVDEVWKLSQDCVLNTQVTGAVWQEEAGVWLVTTRDGQQYRSTWLMAATGTSFKPNIAKIKGLDTFKGAMHHSAAWPEEGVEMEGKRVAIIGAGSTGIQVVQEAAKVADQVVQFIRTPNFAIPMRQRQISEQEIYANKSHIQHVFKACRETRTGLPIVGNGKNTFDVSDEERMKTWDELWKRGGFNWSQGGFSDTILSKDANREAYKYWCRKTRERISDPRKADILAPKDMPYWISTKRPSLEQDYYEMCDQANVDITNSAIEEVTANGVRTKDGKVYEVDIIALCTGYDAVTGGLRTMGIKGKEGIDLDEKWKDGVITHLGMIANGCKYCAQRESWVEEHANDS